ncbi:hemolysin family protein [Candidatus Frankia alpina]|uniref:HlyC/CorC family transporter n=1 Tax=Candidatus Frankia alpina TaxID=2699483 RepID=A0A4V3Z0B7_9ACTN|nr:hemolysin family protein [Candidatus Frankia alpina]THJ46352.1 HlyC/CorC family transporter [Candidatus Frankia alpina]
MTLLALVAGLALIAGNAFFVGAEFAFVSARRDRLEPMVEAGDKRARSVIGTLEHLSPLLAATQLGITLCSLALGAVAEPAVAHLLTDLLHALAVPAAAQHAIAFAVALTIVSALHIVLGEIVPKNLSIAGPERALVWLGPPLIAFARATSPFVLLLNTVANRVLRLLRVEPRDELASAYTPQELAAIIAESKQEGLLEQAEHERLTSALELSDRDAGAVMIPLAQAVTIAWTTTARELEDVVARTGYSRFPVRAPDAATTPSSDAGSGRGTADGMEIAGFLHAKDVLGIAPEDLDTPLAPLRLHRMVELATDTSLDRVLRRMQRAGGHLGRVVDAAGTTVGVIAMEDVVEQFVGEVTDASHRD